MRAFQPERIVVHLAGLLTEEGNRKTQLGWQGLCGSWNPERSYANEQFRQRRRELVAQTRQAEGRSKMPSLMPRFRPWRIRPENE